MRKIKRTEVLALLNRAVEEKGKDFVYVDEEGELGNCAYFHGQEPGCIVGHVMSYIGIKRDDLHMPGTYDFNDSTAIHNPGLHEALRANAKVTFTRSAINVLLVAQSEQDCGIPWGLAVGKAGIDEGKD